MTDQAFGPPDGAPVERDAPDLTSQGSSDSVEEAEASPLANSLKEWAKVMGIALVVALLLRGFVAAPFKIPSGSMHDTLFEGDRILVNKLAYRYGDVERRDVIVFEKPPGVDMGDPKVKHLIKRVIGLPGDVIEIRDCAVIVNGEVQVEPYILGTCTDSASNGGDPDGDGRIDVPPGQYFVMGDNRRPSQSLDSRVWGFLDGDLIVGRAFVVVYPFGHWRWL